MSDPIVVKTVEELKGAPEEYREAVAKLVISHAMNELYGAQVFDEPAIAYAPTPYAKWLTCRVAMEEYGHHVRFKQLGVQMGIPEERMMPGAGKRPLSIFEFPLKTWEEFVAIKLLADLAEILQVEDLLHCTFHPLRNLARATMPEERFHAQFGEDFTAELIKTPEGKATLQAAIDEYFPYLPSFFGGSKSKNNEIFRKWNIKQRTNDEMRAGLHEARDRGRHQVRPHPAGGAAGGVSQVVVLPRVVLDQVKAELRAAAWFAALGEPLTDGDRADADAYARALGLGTLLLGQARDWPEAERVLKAPDWSPAWWDREEVLRQRLLAEAEARYPERALWTALTELTTERAISCMARPVSRRRAWAAPRRPRSMSLPGAAAQAAYQLALARLAGDAASPFESKFRLFAAGRWPLGVVGSTLVLF